MKEVPALGEQALWGSRDRTLDLKGVPTKVDGMAVTPSLFRVLQVGPKSGRAFADAEGEIGSENKVILSNGLWMEVFGGGAKTRSAKQVRLDGKPYEIVGVMPAGFQFVNPEVRFWFPAGI